MLPSWRLRQPVPFAGKEVWGKSPYLDALKNAPIAYANKDRTGIVLRWKDPPPADMEPDPDYVPQTGEWFWWWYGMDCSWGRLKMGTGHVYNEDGSVRGTANNYIGKCLPATAPE